MEADSLCVLANAHLHRGRLHVGIEQARSALTISRQIKNVWGQVNALYDLGAGLCDISKHVRYAIGQAADLIDADSAALFTEISRSIDTWLWLVETHQ